MVIRLTVGGRVARFKEAITGQDIVYANLTGDLKPMAKSIVKAMNETGVKNHLH